MEHMLNFDSILDGTDDAIIIVNEEHKIIFENTQAEQIFGNNFKGMPLSNLIRDSSIIETYQSVLKNKDIQSTEYAVPNFSDNLTMRDNVFNVKISYREHNKGDFITIILKNITEQINLERLRSDFIANVSHELKTPMSTIIGCLETIKSAAANDLNAQKKFLDIMSIEANRLNRLIEDLLTISKIESNEHIFPTNKINILDTVNQVVQNLDKSAKKRNIIFKINSSDQSYFILGNSDELIQVFSNLFENSIKYANKDSEVFIVIDIEINNIVNSIKPLSLSNVVIKLTDKSEGIAKNHLNRLTERFYRIDAARSKEVGGTGLGLAIVKHILKKHRATLEIDSTVGVGSTFTIAFPLVPIS